MTIQIFESTFREMPCWKCVVRLSYKKSDQTRKVQKTYRAVGEVFRVEKDQVEKAFRAQAERWKEQTLERLKNGLPPELKQEEIEV